MCDILDIEKMNLFCFLPCLWVEKFERYTLNRIRITLSRAYQRIAILFKGFSSRDPQLLKRAYIVYVRPILEYCSSVWSPHKIRDIEALERVQRYFTRKLYGLKSFTNDDRLNFSDLESLELRRFKVDLIMYFKIMHDHVDVEKSDFLV